jgi:hypothetical protein
MPKTQSKVGEQVYSNEQIEAAEKLLRKVDSEGNPKHKLVEIAQITGMSRWAVGRLRNKL